MTTYLIIDVQYLCSRAFDTRITPSFLWQTPLECLISRTIKLFTITLPEGEGYVLGWRGQFTWTGYVIIFFHWKEEDARENCCAVVWKSISPTLLWAFLPLICNHMPVFLIDSYKYYLILTPYGYLLAHVCLSSWFSTFPKLFTFQIYKVG